MKKISNYINFISEANLTLQELGKLKDGEHRGNILVNKLKAEDPITLSNNKEVTIDTMKSDDTWEDPKEVISNLTDDGGKWDIDKAKDYLTKGTRYLPVFKDEEGKQWKLNQFKKTDEFGSKGAGRLLMQFESIQIIFIAIKQMFPNSVLTPTNLKRYFTDFKKDPKASSLLYLPEGVEIDNPMFDFFLRDRNWAVTFCKVPNRIWSRSDRFIDTQKEYKIIHSSHKGPSILGTIYSKYREFAKSGGWTDIHFAKFCPADVFLCSSADEFRMKSLLESAEDIENFVKLMNYFFDRKELIPISLKKISHNQPFKIIVNREKGKELPEFYIRSFILNSDSLKGIGSKISTQSVWKHRNDKSVDEKDRKINFDSSNTSKAQNIDGEVEGSTSRHGKISFTAIKRIIDSYSGFSLQELQDYHELKKLTIDELKNEIEKVTLKIMDLEVEDETDLVSIVPATRASDISGSENKLISKLQSLQIVLAIMQLFIIDKEIGNGVVTKMMRYALSIQNDSFTTPRYLRVI